MSNQLIIDNFKKLINLIKYETNNLTNRKDQTLNYFRILGLKNALKAIININYEITDTKNLIKIKGIGKNSIGRIDEILKTGKLIELKNYDKIIKQNQSKENIIDDLVKVIGIGRIVALELINTYHIKSALELKKLSDSGKIHLNDKLKIGLKYLGKFQGSIPRSEIDLIYNYIQDLTNKYDPSMFITICGSYRRGLPISSDIDILLSSLDIMTIDDIVLTNTTLLKYVRFLHQQKFLLDDITDKNIKTKYMGFGCLGSKYPIRRIDIRLVPMISYFPALLYFTGSYEFNQEMRAKAKKMGYKLNEYGLYLLNPVTNTDKIIIVLSEQEMFVKLEMKYLLPSER
jgi:DNA polymerase IV